MVGGGPSGLSAALAARRAGAEVILMERWVLSFQRLKKNYLMTIHHKIWLLWWLYHHRGHGDPGLVQVRDILAARRKCGEKTINEGKQTGLS